MIKIGSYGLKILRFLIGAKGDCQMLNFYAAKAKQEEMLRQAEERRLIKLALRELKDSRQKKKKGQKRNVLIVGRARLV